MHEFPFASPPTDEQRAAVWKLCFQRHGAEHPKVHVGPDGEFKKPYWGSDDPRALVERDVFGPDEVPIVPDRSLSVANAVGVSQFSVHAVGRVE